MSKQLKKLDEAQIARLIAMAEKAETHCQDISINPNQRLGYAEGTLKVIHEILKGEWTL